MADLYAELLAEVRAEREAHRRANPSKPMYPAPSPADDAGVMFPWLCAVVEAQGQAIEELRAEREALAVRVEALEEWQARRIRERFVAVMEKAERLLAKYEAEESTPSVDPPDPRP